MELDKALIAIEKQYGKGSIMTLEDRSVIPCDVISTGCIAIDCALGVGGFPRARISEIAGPESSGKTTLAMHCVAQAQRAGGLAAYIDMEHAVDPKYAKALGVNTKALLISQPDYGEQALGIVETLAATNAVSLIVVDSVSALVPKAELDGEIGDSHMGLQARMMSQAMRKLAGLIAKSNTALIFINQIREKIGVMFGNPETTSGGRALKFSASIRVDIRRISAIKDGDTMIGNRTRVKVVKNKVAPPFREAEFDILFGQGISFSGDLLDMAVASGIVTKAGAWYSYGDKRIGQGREQAKTSLTEDRTLYNTIYLATREAVGVG